MKTEEKAKAYDEALEQAQKELAVCGSINCDAARQIFRLFPQLRESEDERTRKWLVNLVENLGEPADEDAEKELDEMRPLALAYLEKQKDHFRDDTKMVEQKSAENDVDVIKTSALLAADRLASAEMTGRLKERSEILENPEEYGLQKPAEWSKEDENIINNICDYLLGELRFSDVAKEKAIVFLHSLRPPKGWKEGWCEDCKVRYNHWKPSEEQIEALNYAIAEWDGGKKLEGLYALRTDLKKLM